MKMSVLAHAPINQLTLVRVRLEPAQVPARHRFVMEPAPVERFIYITHGTVRFRLDGGELGAGARDMVYLPRDTAYQSFWLEDSEFMVVDLLLQDSDGQEIRFGDCPSVLFHDSHQVYDALLAELAQKAETDGPFDWLERMSLTFRLLCDMARDTNREELDAQQQRIQAGITYLERHLTEDFPVEQLAQLCSLSPTQFRRIFLACKGMSPVEYRNRLRIRRASELLRTGSCTVGEAAEQVGIRDISYFGKLFRRFTGQNPGIYRKNGTPDTALPKNNQHEKDGIL